MKCPDIAGPQTSEIAGDGIVVLFDSASTSEGVQAGLASIRRRPAVAPSRQPATRIPSTQPTTGVAWTFCIQGHMDIGPVEFRARQSIRQPASDPSVVSRLEG